MDQNPYQAPQTTCNLPSTQRVPTWRKVVGGAIFFSIIGPFLLAPVIYIVALMVAAYSAK
jgi:hypothetical protein